MSDLKEVTNKISDICKNIFQSQERKKLYIEDVITEATKSIEQYWLELWFIANRCLDDIDKNFEADKEKEAVKEVWLDAWIKGWNEKWNESLDHEVNKLSSAHDTKKSVEAKNNLLTTYIKASELSYAADHYASKSVKFERLADDIKSTASSSANTKALADEDYEDAVEFTARALALRSRCEETRKIADKLYSESAHILNPVAVDVSKYAEEKASKAVNAYIEEKSLVYDEKKKVALKYIEENGANDDRYSYLTEEDNDTELQCNYQTDRKI